MGVRDQFYSIKRVSILQKVLIRTFFFRWEEFRCLKYHSKVEDCSLSLEKRIMLVELVKSESRGLGPDSTDMALALSQSPFYYRALTDISENFEWYRIPFNRMAAFALPPEHLARVDLQEMMEWSSFFRETIRWDQTRTPEGWTAYSDHEKLQFIAAWFKKTLTDLTVYLIKSR